jgi:hypothetical protein
LFVAVAIAIRSGADRLRHAGSSHSLEHQWLGAGRGGVQAASSHHRSRRSRRSIVIRAATRHADGAVLHTMGQGTLHTRARTHNHRNLLAFRNSSHLLALLALFALLDLRWFSTCAL